jgi:hypothetical protein
VGERGEHGLGAFRALTPKGVPTRKLLPGAITGGICWTVLQVLGTYLVHHFLHSDSVYGVFGTVLGLLAWIALAVQLTVYCAEINVVLARRLWPRSIVQPPLTEADRASMALQALQNQRRPEQHIEVTFDDRRPGTEEPARTPRTPDEVAPPAEARVPEQRTGTDEGTAARERIAIAGFLDFHGADLVEAVGKRQRKRGRNVLRDHDSGSVRGQVDEHLLNGFGAAGGRADGDDGGRFVRAQSFDGRLVVSEGSGRPATDAGGGRGADFPRELEPQLAD